MSLSPAHRRTRRAGAVLLALTLAFAAAACGDDDGADVREQGPGASGGSGSGSGSGSGPASGSASAPASGSGSAPASGSGSGSAAAAGECTPVGTELAGDAVETVAVTLDDYAFGPASLDLPAGTVTFAAENVGGEPHELAFLPGGGDVPLTEEGTPDEDALAAAGAFELEAFAPGQTCEATFELEPGPYTVFCIVEAPDGETHLQKGMRADLVVG